MTRVDLKKSGILIGALTAAIFAGATGVKAEDDDTSGVFMKDMLGKIGIIEPSAPQIDYRERAPLVLPPGDALPAPRASTDAASHPNWPKDPDVKARQRAIDAAKAPISSPSDSESARVLRPDEISKGRRVGGGGVSTPNSEACAGDACSARPLNPKQLKVEPTRRGPAVVHGQEPGRSSLTEPPKGYRLPAGNAPISEGASEPIKDDNAASPYNFFKKND